jgi:hypothetical protein
MSTIAVTGAVIIFLVGAAHSYLGERYILIRLFRRQDLPHLFGSDVFTKRTLRLAWHITTVGGWGLSVVLLQVAAGAAPSSVGATIAGTSLICGLVALSVSRGRHLSWVAFFAVALLAWYATR